MKTVYVRWALRQGNEHYWVDFHRGDLNCFTADVQDSHGNRVRYTATCISKAEAERCAKMLREDVAGRAVESLG